MTKKWKIAIVILFVLIAWIRLAPAIKWSQEASEDIDWWIYNDYYSYCSEFYIDYDWSWWSLRFTRIRADCKDDL